MLRAFYVLSTASALFYMLLWSMLKRSEKTKAGPVLFEVLERSNKRTTLRSPARFKWHAGLFYATFFYLGLPVFIWRYGIYKSLALIVFTLATGFGASFAIGLFFSLQSETKILLGILISIPMRAAVGVYVGENDLKFRRQTLIKREWRSLGFCNTKSKKEALSFF